MAHHEAGWIEADVTINGRMLTVAEALTLRVAVANFALMLGDPKIRKGLGDALANNYSRHLARIHRLMLPTEQAHDA